ncbi:hypothetical protein C0J52_18026 [Blattella germanica]|nr:hypothetical protein C0J52_18026 [Blattella germanica]
MNSCLRVNDLLALLYTFEQHDINSEEVPNFLLLLTLVLEQLVLFNIVIVSTDDETGSEECVSNSDSSSSASSSDESYRLGMNNKVSDYTGEHHPLWILLKNLSSFKTM